MILSVVVPVYNEEAYLEQILKSVKSLQIPGVEIKLVVVDDGSTDRSNEIAQAVLDPRLDVLVRHEKNLGKGKALRTAASFLSGGLVIIQDADLEYSPRDIPRVIAPLLENVADVVYGSRFSGSEAKRVLYFWHAVGNRLLTTLSNFFTNLNLTDMETGYKAFSVEVFKRLDISERGFGVEPEITAKVAKMGVRVFEVSVSYRGRTYEEGKKIGWKDGFWAVYCIVRYSLSRIASEV